MPSSCGAAWKRPARAPGREPEREAAHRVDVDGVGHVYTVHPHMESNTANNDVLAVCGQWYAVVGSNTALGDFHLRVSAGGDGSDADFGRLMPMCRLGGLSLSADGDAMIAEWTASTVVALDTDTSASVSSTSERNHPVMNAARQFTLTIGPDMRGQSAPYSAAATYTQAKRLDFTADFEWEIARAADSGWTVTGTSDREVVDANLTVSLGVENSDNEGSTLKRMLAKEEQRVMVMAFGPGYEPGTDTPCGGAIYGVFARTEDESAVSAGDQNLMRRDVTLAVVNDAPNIADASTAKAVAPFAILHPLG